MSDPYPLDMYGSMLEDPVRMTAYRAAMAAAIKPGDVVIDIGTGPGVTAMLACQLGASHVYAIDPNPAISIGERLARQNGYADRITFVRGLSTEFSVENRVDVLVSDLRGKFPLHGQHIPSIVDARERLLKHGGIQIPTRDRLFVGLARDDYQYQRLRRPWMENNFDLDLSPAYDSVVNLTSSSAPATTVAVGDGACWAELDYTSVRNPNASGRVTLAAPEGATVNALELWFEAELLPGICYATSPRDPFQVYARTLLPLREQLKFEGQDVVEVALDMRLAGSKYLTTWTTVVRNSLTGAERLRLVHSTFKSTLLSSRDLGARAPNHIPARTPRCFAASVALAHLAEGLTIRDLAERVHSGCEGVFPSREAAENFVADLLATLG